MYFSSPSALPQAAQTKQTSIQNFLKTFLFATPNCTSKQPRPVWLGFRTAKANRFFAVWAVPIGHLPPGCCGCVCIKWRYVQWILLHLSENHALANWHLRKSSCSESSSLNHTCDMGVSEFRIRHSCMIFWHRYTSNVAHLMRSLSILDPSPFCPAQTSGSSGSPWAEKVLRFKFAGQKDVVKNSALQQFGKKSPRHLEIQHTYPRTKRLID